MTYETLVLSFMTGEVLVIEISAVGYKTLDAVDWTSKETPVSQLTRLVEANKENL
jgi:hypothetical protein